MLMRRALPSILTIVLLLSLLPLGLSQGLLAEVQSFTLDNGLQVLLVARKGVPIVAVDMWVNTGSINETKENNGISHFFEHMLFKGTERRPPGIIDREIEGVGGRTNAATSYDWTHYYAILPSQYTDLAIDILADVTRNSTFPEEEIEREREVVFREMAQRSDDPTSFIFFTLNQEFFKIHPYGLPIIGTEESLNNLERDDFLNYMREYYVPNNMVLVIVGDIDPATVSEKVKEVFANFAPKEIPQRERPAEPPPSEKKVLEIPRDVAQGYMVIAWPAPGIEGPKDVYAMDTLLAILSQGRGSRFYKNIKKPGLVTAIDASFFTRKDPGMFSVYAEFPVENRQKVEGAILAELKRILDGDLSARELERAKTITLSSYSFDAETNAGLASTLGFYAIVAGDYEFALTYPEGIRGMTVEDIVQTARRYINLEKYVEIVLVPE